jgi:hypothetical protein
MEFEPRRSEVEAEAEEESEEESEEDEAEEESEEDEAEAVRVRAVENRLQRVADIQREWADVTRSDDNANFLVGIMRLNYDMMSYVGDNRIAFSWKQEADNAVYGTFIPALAALNFGPPAYRKEWDWEGDGAFNFGSGGCFELKTSHTRFMSIWFR